MAKQSIEWHEKCLVNMEASVERHLKAMRDEQSKAVAAAKAISILKAQIARAKKEGRSEFDRERFKVPEPTMLTPAQAQLKQYMSEWLLDHDATTREAWNEVKTAVFDALS